MFSCLEPKFILVWALFLIFNFYNMEQFLIQNGEQIFQFLTTVLLALIARRREKQKLRKAGVLKDESYLIQKAKGKI
mgnify:CR=1 FL=1